MGMTLWIHTLDGRKISRESDDHSFMHDLADDLDSACVESGIEKFSSFFDFTDLELNMSDELSDDDSDDESEEHSENESELDEETGLSYGIDDMKWFDVKNGLTTLESLRSLIAGAWNPALDQESREMLLEEFDDCITKLKELPQESGKFHLAVIM